MHLRHLLLFALLCAGLLIAFLLDIMWGSVALPAREVVETLLGQSSDTTNSYIVLSFRLPKALTAVIAGAGVSIAGLLMQTLFRNPLADTSILGINSGAGVGVAIYTMAYAFFPTVALAPGLFQTAGVVSTWGIIGAACLGAMGVLLAISVVSSRLHDLVSVLLVGVMFGFLASSIISILQYFSDQETLKTYLLWSFGSVSGTTWRQLSVMLPILLTALLCTLFLPKSLNALALGEHYAHSVGANIRLIRRLLIVLTSIIAGCITAFTGPIAFLGMAVPHFVRLIFRTADHHILVPATLLTGSFLLLLCDLLTQLPGAQMILPINAITSLLGAPVVLLVLLGGKRKPSTFR